MAPSFASAIDLLFHCRGRVVVTGMGKSGIVARKIAATLSSTGTRHYSSTRSRRCMAISAWSCRAM